MGRKMYGKNKKAAAAAAKEKTRESTKRKEKKCCTGICKAYQSRSEPNAEEENWKERKKVSSRERECWSARAHTQQQQKKYD